MELPGTVTESYRHTCNNFRKLSVIHWNAHGKVNDCQLPPEAWHDHLCHPTPRIAEARGTDALDCPTIKLADCLSQRYF
ncbi:hypothetical protein EMIT047CA2_280027 [Pseudomonas soli]